MGLQRTVNRVGHNYPGDNSTEKGEEGKAVREQEEKKKKRGKGLFRDQCPCSAKKKEKKKRGLLEFRVSPEEKMLRPLTKVRQKSGGT